MNGLHLLIIVSLIIIGYQLISKKNFQFVSYTLDKIKDLIKEIKVSQLHDYNENEPTINEKIKLFGIKLLFVLVSIFSGLIVGVTILVLLIKLFEENDYIIYITASLAVTSTFSTYAILLKWYKKPSKKQIKPSWLNEEVYSKGGTVTNLNLNNRKQIKLSALELTIYDKIIGFAMMEDVYNAIGTYSKKEVPHWYKQAIDWFRINNPLAFELLLDSLNKIKQLNQNESIPTDNESMEKNELFPIEKIIIKEEKNEDGSIESIEYRITEQENYSYRQNYNKNGNLKSIDLLFRKKPNDCQTYCECLYFKDGNEILFEKTTGNWKGDEIVISEMRKFEKLVRKQLNLNDSKPSELFNGPFYFDIREESWYGKENKFFWCQIFKFWSLDEYNEITENGTYEHDFSSCCGEFYYESYSNKYVTWDVIRDDFTDDGFLRLGNGIRSDSFKGTNDELLNYLRLKYGGNLEINLISNMEPI